MLQGLEHEVQAWADSLGSGWGAVGGGCGACQQVGEVFALRRVELEGVCEGFDDFGGGGSEPALFEGCVVLGAHAGEAGDLASASPDLLRAMVKTFAEAMMSADVDRVCGGEYGRPSEDRVNFRNG